MQYANQHFSDERINLDAKSFHHCEFENCELVFSGDRPPTFSDNSFRNCQFVMTGAATRTLYLLSNIYHAGKGGRDVVDSLIDAIRRRDVHGHEIYTKVPNTTDKSFA